MNINLQEMVDSSARDNTVTVVLVEALVEYEKAHGIKFMELVGDSKNVAVEFKINGREMDFLKVMEHLSIAIDQCVGRKADRLLKEKFGDTIERLDTAVAAAVSKFRDEAGIPEED